MVQLTSWLSQKPKFMKHFLLASFIFQAIQNHTGLTENIPSKSLRLHSFTDDVESIIFVINLHKRKWLLCGCYNPHRKSVDYFLEHLSKALHSYVSLYDNIFILGNFNCEEFETPMSMFCDTLKNLIKESNCFKNIENQINTRAL